MRSPKSEAPQSRTIPAEQHMTLTQALRTQYDLSGSLEPVHHITLQVRTLPGNANQLLAKGLSGVQPDRHCVCTSFLVGIKGPGFKRLI